jgi:hypothetical protein
MRVANRGQSAVSFPSIGSDFAVKLNTFFDRGNQAGPRGVFDFVETNSTGTTISNLNRHKDKCFTSGSMAPFTRMRSSNIEQDQPNDLGQDEPLPYAIDEAYSMLSHT